MLIIAKFTTAIVSAFIALGLLSAAIYYFEESQLDVKKMTFEVLVEHHITKPSELPAPGSPLESEIMAEMAKRGKEWGHQTTEAAVKASIIPSILIGTLLGCSNLLPWCRPAKS